MHSVVKAAAAAVTLLAAVLKEQRQMSVMLPGVHLLASNLIQCLEQPGVADRLRPELLRLGSSSGGREGGSTRGSSSSSGSSGATNGGSVLLFEQLLFVAYLVRWQANLAMVQPPLDQLLPAGREAAVRENAAGGRRMAQLLPDCPLGWFAHSSALLGLGRYQEAWGLLERCRQVGAGLGMPFDTDDAAWLA